MVGRRNACALGAVLMLSLAPLDAAADIATLTSDRDNTLFEEDGALSNGAGDHVFVGTTDAGDARRTLMRFDIAGAVPAGSTITSVTLSLFNSRAKSNADFDVSLHSATRDWGEAASHASGEEGAGASALTGDATWSHAFYATTSWSSAGGDFVASASATTPVGRDGRRYEWTAAGLTADVQRWLDTPSTNHGWVIVGVEVGTRSAKRFDSHQSADASRRPVLTVVYTLAAATGACCASSGSCGEVTSASCSGSYQGDGTSCASVSCPLPTGACCSSVGMCSVTTSAACGGTYEGDGTSCSPSPCPVPDGACCASSGGCSLVADPGTSCTGTYLGAASSCSPNPCMAVTGACCSSDGSCAISVHPGSSCSGSYLGRDTVCAPNPCPQPVGACCASDGACTSVTSSACGGTWRGAASTCSPNPCSQPTGACCATDGGCSVVTAAACTGSWMGMSSMCAPNPCPQPIGACCASDGGCSLTEAGACVGAWDGTAMSCTPSPCAQPVGACCANDSSCTLETDAVCRGTWLGPTSSCTDEPCPLVLEPFVDSLPLPAVATPVTGMSGDEAEYRMSIVQVQQRLHRDLPPTTVWAYDDGTTGGTYPGPTIEARVDRTVRVTWLNDLREIGGTPRTDHVLSVDPCPHGAELPGARTVVHLHGGHVAAEYDGYPEATILPGESTTYEYPNWQDAASIWYHDHALGITRLNVYMGLAGLYTIRDAVEDALDLPRGEFEVPLVIQDRTLRPDGSLDYPAEWVEHFFGEVNLVNGRVTPYLEVAQGRYRFRMLNGANSRTYTLYLSNGADFTLIGVDGGLLDAPVSVNEITLGPAERADVIVDFSALPPGAEVFIQNRAPAPYPGPAGVGVLPDVMKLVVVDRPGHVAAVPTTLRPLETLREADSVVTRDFVLSRSGGDECGGRAWLINDLGWNDITERPALGTTEIWSFVNRSGRSHPMHMHLVFFQVLDRQPFEIIDGTVTPIGSPMEPEPWERGWKDTVTVGPNETVRVIARFEDFVGRFPYHCHVLEHEDHEMMRQFETTTSCGDGFLGLPVEECDDGNTNDGDGCSSACDVELPFDAGAPDAGSVADAGLDSGPDAGMEPVDGGCGCRASRPRGSLPLALLMLALLGIVRRRSTR